MKPATSAPVKIIIIKAMKEWLEKGEAPDMSTPVGVIGTTSTMNAHRQKNFEFAPLRVRSLWEH